MKLKRIIYNGKAKNARSVCCHCKTFFSDGDEIILCPVDNEPHHKKCWKENKGCSKGDYREKTLMEKIPVGNIIKNIVLGIIFISTILFIVFVTGQIMVEKKKIAQHDLNLTIVSSPLPEESPTIFTEETPPAEETPLSPEETAVSSPLPEETEKSTPTEEVSSKPTLAPEELEPFEKEPPENTEIVNQKEKNTENIQKKVEEDIQKKAVKVAIKQIGKPYIWETTGPDSFDCAGLCGYAYWMASNKKWNEWHIFYVSDMLKLCNIHRDFSEIRPGDLLVRKNYQYLKPFAVRNEEGPEYDKYDTEAQGWPYGESPVHDYGHIGMYVGDITYEGQHYKNAVIEARGKDFGVLICETDRDGDGQMEWGNFFYRPKKAEN